MDFGIVTPAVHAVILQPPTQYVKAAAPLPDGTRVYLSSCGAFAYVSYASGVNIFRKKNGTAFVNASNGDFWFGFEELWMRVN